MDPEAWVSPGPTAGVSIGKYHERRQGRLAANADIRQAIERLMAQSDAEIGSIEGFREGYRKQLELQWSRV